jgi:hypothetical protein
VVASQGPHLAPLPHSGALCGPSAKGFACPGCGGSITREASATGRRLPTEARRRLGKFEFLKQPGRGALGTAYKPRDTELSIIGGRAPFAFFADAVAAARAAPEATQRQEDAAASRAEGQQGLVFYVVGLRARRGIGRGFHVRVSPGGCRWEEQAPVLGKGSRG